MIRLINRNRIVHIINGNYRYKGNREYPLPFDKNIAKLNEFIDIIV